MPHGVHARAHTRGAPPLPPAAHQVGGLRIAWSAHTHPGADPGGNTKDNQVRSRPPPPPLSPLSASLSPCPARGGRMRARAGACTQCAAMRLLAPPPQDAWVAKERLGPMDAALFGVFDGHGQEGKLVSHHVCATLPRLASRSSLCRVSARR
jgi:hypothetical protein